MIGNLDAIADVLSTIKKSTKKPLTIKIRKMQENILKPILKLAEKYCSAISVHPRTQPQGYSGEPDLEFARSVKSQTKLPVIYSGNISSKEQAESLLKEFDFIMIGRAAIGNPSIFSDLTGKEVKKRISFHDWLKLAKKTEKSSLNFSQIKLQAINFTRDFEGSAKIRNKLSLAKTEKEILDILRDVKPNDWDITTNAKPEQIRKLFPKNFYENQFGTVSVITDSKDETLKIVEITPFRL
ncbi:MAG: tRNA-dihydrouridine synthase, partial [Candidatus Nealsonbacteria bacterium]|nr:tRNA-dihydrouridine synthase [Candidatus Nealsonbacteria bacterium]